MTHEPAEFLDESQLWKFRLDPQFVEYASDDDMIFLASLLEQSVRKAWPQASEDALQQWGDVPYSATIKDAHYNVGAALWASDQNQQAAERFLVGFEDVGSRELGLAAAEALVWLGNDGGRLEKLLLELAAVKDEIGDVAAGILGVRLLDHESSSPEVGPLLARATEIDPIRFGHRYAEVQIAAREFKQAKEVLLRAVSAGSESAPLLLGNLLLDEFGDAAGAEEMYRLGIDRGDNHSRFNLGLLLVDNGNGVDGERWIEEAARDGDSVAASWLKRARS